MTVWTYASHRRETNRERPSRLRAHSRTVRSQHASVLYFRALLLCSAGWRTEHIGAAVDAVERLERARAADVKALQRKKCLGARCKWEGPKRERPKWEGPKWERPKWEGPKWERPEWERA